MIILLNHENPSLNRRLSKKWIALIFLLLAGHLLWVYVGYKKALSEAKAFGVMVDENRSFFEIYSRHTKAGSSNTVDAGFCYLEIPSLETASNCSSLVRYISPTALVILDGQMLSDLQRFSEFPQLTRLSLVGCNRLTSISGGGSLTVLVMLEIIQADALTSVDGLENIIQLESLRIARCHRLSKLDNVDALRNLRTLSISDCPALASIESIKRLDRLQYVSIDNCPNITMASINTVKAALKGTRIDLEPMESDTK